MKRAAAMLTLASLLDFACGLDDEIKVREFKNEKQFERDIMEVGINKNFSSWPMNEVNLKKRAGSYLLLCCNPSSPVCQKFNAEVWQRVVKDFLGSNVLMVFGDYYKGGGKALCENIGCEMIKGTERLPSGPKFKEPCLGHFDKTTMQDGTGYKGGQSYEALRKFVKKTLRGIERTCTVENQILCTAPEKAKMAELKDRSVEDLKQELAILQTRQKNGLKSHERYDVESSVSMLKVVLKSKRAPADGSTASSKEAKEDL